MSLVDAVKEFRRSLGESQQAFATRLGISIRAVANYEKDREPKGRILALLGTAARTSGMEKLADVFDEALMKEFGRGVSIDFLDTIRMQILKAQVTLMDIRREVLTDDQNASLKAALGQLSEITDLLAQQNPLSARIPEEDAK